jgi:hypothetical protein
MNITGELTGKDASQARAAILPPPSMENVTSRDWRKTPETSRIGERNPSGPRNKGKAYHRLRAKEAQTSSLRLGERRRSGRSLSTLHT